MGIGLLPCWSRSWTPGLPGVPPAPGSGTEKGRASHPIPPTFSVFSFQEGDQGVGVWDIGLVGAG